MAEVFIVDLIHLCPEYNEKRLKTALSVIDCDKDSHLFLLFRQHCQGSNATQGNTRASMLDDCLNRRRDVHLLDYGTVTEDLYRFKLTVDELDISSVKVITSTHGRALLELYQNQLFTAVYKFEYLVTFDALPCSRSPTLDTHVTPVLEEVSTFLQQLPAVKGDITILTSTLILGCFSHGFSTRTGGISSIPTLSSLNLFSSSRRRDPRAIVAENSRRLALRAGFHPRPLHLVKVNHGSTVWVMGRTEPESYDGIVTNQMGVVIAAPGADCMPLLFTDPVSNVIGAAHAGWKGTLMGIAMTTVNAMVTEFGCRERDITVAIGPSVGVCCFTLEREQAREFHLLHPDCVPDLDSHRPHVNIRLATRILLQRVGVLPHHIHDDTVTDRPCVTPCTSCHPESFFSNVRDGVNFGTQIGFLWMEETETPDITDDRQRHDNLKTTP